MDASAIAKRLGKRGGQMTASRHGKKHFSAAGKKGMAKRWGTRPVEQQPTRDRDHETAKQTE